MEQHIFLIILSLIILAVDVSNAASQQLIRIPAGVFQLGVSDGLKNQRPVRVVSVPPFSLDRTEVTNAEFEVFVRTTRYITQAEHAGWGWVWNGAWQQVLGANWRQPQGPHSNLTHRVTHPVVQVSWFDAQAYCQWRRLRLPTDVEWEYAARGSGNRLYPWGNVLPRADRIQRANYGTEACCAPDSQDGHVLTAPVGSYPAGVSSSGVHDLAGNVWEWVADNPLNHSDLKILRGGGWGSDANSLLATYRQFVTPTASLDMVGFRCAGPL